MTYPVNLNSINGFQAATDAYVSAGVQVSGRIVESQGNQFKRDSGTWADNIQGKYCWCYRSDVGQYSGEWRQLHGSQGNSNTDTLTLADDQDNFPIGTTAVKIYSNSAPTIVKINTTDASVAVLANSKIVSIINTSNTLNPNDDYVGLYTISNYSQGETETTFTIAHPYEGTQSGFVWQLARARPNIVMLAGESINSLRESVNQISSDTGNIELLSATIPDKRSVVHAINAVNVKLIDTVNSIFAVTWYDLETFVVTTFNGMESVLATPVTAKYAIIGPQTNVDPAHPQPTAGALVKVKLDFSLTLNATAHDIIRYTLPFNCSCADIVVPAMINITTNSLTESGLQTWAGGSGDLSFDIHRNNGINFTTAGSEWHFKLRTEFDII